MSDLPEIDFASIAKTLSSQKSDAEFQSLQWQNLATSLQTKVEGLEKQLEEATTVREQQPFPDAVEAPVAE